MRILTVRQPWAWALVQGGKTVENRPRNIAGDYRGLVAIHAGLTADLGVHQRDSWPALADAMYAAIREDDTLQPGAMPWQTGMGAIIGVANLVDAHLCSGDCSPWAEGPVDLGHGRRDLWHLVFANSRPLAEPIAFTGALGLRRLTPEVTARVLAAIA